MRQQKRILGELIAHVPLGVAKVPVRYGETPTEKAGEEVSGNYFSGLRARILRGSGFTESDETNHNPVVVLSYSFWTEDFSRNPAVVGQMLFIKGIPFTIVGITAPGFLGTEPSRAVDFWIPLQTRPELNAWGLPATTHTLYGSPRWWALPMVARLQPGITPQQAEEALQPAFWQAATEPLGRIDNKVWPAHLGFEAIRGVGDYAREYRQPVKIMMALVILVLLIACTNVALLILARNAAREREFAVRMALGAQASRVFRQLLVESLLLVTAGASLGWVLAIAATKTLAIWARTDASLSPDDYVLIFTVSIACLTTLIFGLVPLRTTLHVSIEQKLKSGASGVTLSRSRVRAANLSVAIQIAMCLALLVASCLTVRSLLNYQRQDLGMQADRLLVFDLNPQALANDVQASSFYGRLLERLKAIPGVQAVSFVRTRPGAGWESTGGITLDGVDVRQDAPPHVSVTDNAVGPDFFHTVGIPVVRGRDISEADTASSPPVVLVNETFEERFLTHGALGHHVGRLPGAEIVGVVKDSKYARVRELQLPAVYYPLSQFGSLGQITVEVRTVANPMILLSAVRKTVPELDPNLPVQKPMTQAAQFAETYVTPRLFARLALGFALAAVLLVASGLYGMLSYRVQRRISEIGIRMALGAPPGIVMWMILAESLLMFGIGAAFGLPMAFLVSRFLSSQLYQLSYMDIPSFAVAIAVTFLIAIAAALLPGRRAAKIDPLTALRYE